MTQEQLPAKEPNLNTEGLQRRVQQLKVGELQRRRDQFEFCVRLKNCSMICAQDLLSEWESQGKQVQELNKSSSELESLIISITAPQNKTGNHGILYTPYITISINEPLIHFHLSYRCHV